MASIDELCNLFNSVSGPPSINAVPPVYSEFRQNNVPIVEEYDEESDNNHLHEFLQIRADIRSIKSDIYDIRMMLSSILTIITHNPAEYGSNFEYDTDMQSVHLEAPMHSMPQPVPQSNCKISDIDL